MRRIRSAGPTREEALGAWLAEHGVDEAWQLAPPLAAAGADVAWCERARRACSRARARARLDWVAEHAVATATLLGELKESTRRISELVAAVESYSQLDRASLQRIDVAEGIESTLVMLGHKLADGVDGRPRLRAPTCRRSRRTPASSTRSGPT